MLPLLVGAGAHYALNAAAERKLAVSDRPVREGTRQTEALKKHVSFMQQPVPVSTQCRWYQGILPMDRPMLYNKPPPPSQVRTREKVEKVLRADVHYSQEDEDAFRSLRNQTYNADIPFTGRNGSTKNWRIEWSRTLPIMEDEAEIVLGNRGSWEPQQGVFERRNYLGAHHLPHELHSPASHNRRIEKTYPGVWRMGGHVTRLPMAAAAF